MKTVRTLAAAILTLGLVVTAAVAADPKNYGQYPCDPHPRLPPIILPPITKFPPLTPKVPAPTAPKPAPAKVTKGK